MFTKSRQGLYVVLAILIALFVVPQSRTVFAHPARQTSTPNTVEIVGVIDAINGKTLTVNNLTIDISKAQVNAALTVGAKIKIEGAISADGLTITARQVNAPKTGILAGETEIVGVVESVTGTTIVVSGQTIDITNAEVKAGVLAGKLVKVEFVVDSTGKLVAREVTVTPAATQPVGTKPSVTKDDFEITGTLEEIGDGFVVVNGQRIDTTGTEIKGQLVFGALVKIEMHNGENEISAKGIENSHPEDNHRNSGSTNSGKGNGSGGKSGSDDPKNSSDDKGGQSGQDDKGGQSGNSGSGGNSGGDNSGSGNSGGGGGGHDDPGGHH